MFAAPLMRDVRPLIAQSITSLDATSGGQAFHTNPVPVNAGDTLIGVRALTGQSGSLFNYTSEFQGINGTSLPVQKRSLELIQV